MKLTRPLPVTAEVTSSDSFRSEGTVNVVSSAPAAGALYHVIVISFQLVVGTRRSTTFVPALPTNRNDSVAFSTSVTPWTSNMTYPRRSGLPRLSTVQDVPKFPPGMSTLTCVSHCEPSPNACIPGAPPEGAPSAPAAWDAPRTSVADSSARTRVAWRSRPDGRCLDDGDRIAYASGEGGTVGIGSTPGHGDPLDGVLRSDYGTARPGALLHDLELVERDRCAGREHVPRALVPELDGVSSSTKDARVEPDLLRPVHGRVRVDRRDVRAVDEDVYSARRWTRQSVHTRLPAPERVRQRAPGPKRRCARRRRAKPRRTLAPPAGVADPLARVTDGGRRRLPAEENVRRVRPHLDVPRRRARARCPLRTRFSTVTLTTLRALSYP